MPTKLTQNSLLKWAIPPPTDIEIIPAASTEVYTSSADAKFMELGGELALAKKPLDDIPAADFAKLMRGLDLYAGLKRKLRQDYNMTIATNASLKMYELISTLRLLPREDGCGNASRVRAFCNAELPGAFIVAINHYIKTTCPSTDFDWVASSYYPAASGADSTILEDQYGLYAGNRDRWLMGPPPNAMPANESPVSGNLMSADVVAALADAVHTRFGGATIYTSDAGIDVSQDFSREEELTSLLNFGQALCGILSLARGGCLITKQFTFMRPFTRSLIALLAGLFDELKIVKPLTSRPANSEIYVVGRGFRGCPVSLADALLDRLAAYNEVADGPCAGPPLLAPEAFADTDSALLRVATQLYGRQQIAFLHEATGLWKKTNLDNVGHMFASAAARAQEVWLAENPMRRINPEALLPAAESKSSYDRRESQNGRRQRGGGSARTNGDHARTNGDHARTNGNHARTNGNHARTSGGPARSGPRRVHITAKSRAGGLGCDVEVLTAAVMAAGGVMVASPESADIQFHLEHVGKISAPINYLVVNQEFLFDWDINAITDGKVVALCKSEFARKFLQDKFNVSSILIGFTSPPIKEIDWAFPRPLILHIAGESHLKGSLEVLRAWHTYHLTAPADLLVVRRPSAYMKDPHDLSMWDSWQPVSASLGRLTNLERHQNIYLARRELTTDEHAAVMRAAAIHVCPSLAEGFGHTISMAKSLGGAVITTDAAPMNEFVRGCGVVVSTDPAAMTTMRVLNPSQRRYYPQAVADLTAASASVPALAREMLPRSEYHSQLGAAAKARFVADAEKFRMAIAALVG